MNRIPLIKPLITAFAILILFGCTTEEPPPLQTRTPEAAPLSTLRPTVQTDTPSPSAPDPTPSATITLETATALPTIATQTTTAATLTPLPTLQGEELELAVAELLANPMNCDVPCWWGAMPGVTTVFEIQQFLTLYQFTVRERNDDQIPDYLEVWVGYDQVEDRLDFRVMYSFENNVLKTVFSEQSPQLHDMVEKYGQPDQIWLNSMPFEREGSLIVRLNLLYLDEGMAVGYVVDDGNIQDGIVTGCFAKEEMGRLQLNIPGSSTGYSNFSGVFDLGRPYKTLESATNLTMEDFMQQFSDPDHPQCIQTPVELWE